MIIQSVLSGWITSFRIKENKGSVHGMIDLLQVGDGKIESSVVPIYVFDPKSIEIFTKATLNQLEPFSAIVTITYDKSIYVALKEIIEFKEMGADDGDNATDSGTGSADGFNID